MRAVVVVALHRHEFHVEEAVVILLRLARAQQPLVARPEEKLAENSLVLGLRIALGNRQQVVVETVEMCLAAGVQRSLDETDRAIEVARLRRRATGFRRRAGGDRHQAGKYAEDLEGGHEVLRVHYFAPYRIKYPGLTV